MRIPLSRCNWIDTLVASYFILFRFNFKSHYTNIKRRQNKIFKASSTATTNQLVSYCINIKYGSIPNGICMLFGFVTFFILKVLSSSRTLPQQRQLAADVWHRDDVLRVMQWIVHKNRKHYSSNINFVI